MKHDIDWSNNRDIVKDIMRGARIMRALDGNYKPYSDDDADVLENYDKQLRENKNGE